MQDDVQECERERVTLIVKNAAAELGFGPVGIATAGAPATLEHLQRWIDLGHAGDMGYMSSRASAYEHPDSVLPGVRSMVVVGLNYFTAIGQLAPLPGSGESPDTGGPAGVSEVIVDSAVIEELAAVGVSSLPVGRIANYALGVQDYHDVIRQRLKQLAVVLHEQVPGCRARGVVDTAPLLERDFAQRAGLGWFGKNTMLINRKAGSWLFLAVLLTDFDLIPDNSHATSHCGTCTRCLDACPTDAFVAPHVLDARRCISYLTIEQRHSPVPVELRDDMGNWVFGCDVCQDVCPWNRKAPASSDEAFVAKSDLSPVNLGWLLSLSPESFRERFRGTPFDRPGRSGVLRNAAIAAGNSGDRLLVPALIALLDDADDLIRGAAAWALGKLATESGREALRRRNESEQSADVRLEIRWALDRMNQHSGESA